MNSDKLNVQRRYLPSHSVLRSFECAARHGSFTLAAEELNLTQSAISRQVKDLENIIGASLFRRVGRRVVLTKAGQQLAQDIAVDLENLQLSIMRAVSAGKQGTAIRTAVLPGFASRWLIPRLPDFTALHPDIELSFSTRLEPFDMTRERFDLAVHFGNENWPDTDMRLLSSETMIAVAAPSFVKAHEITSIDGLVTAPLLHMETRPTIWSQYFEKAGLQHSTVLSGKYFDQFSMIIAAAVAALGAALVPTYLIESELSSGRLVPISSATVTTRNSYYLVTPINRKVPEVELFSNWMVQAIKKQIL